MHNALTLALAAGLGLGLAACKGDSATHDGGDETAAPIALPQPPGETHTLLLAQAWFEDEIDPDDASKTRVVPAPGKLQMIWGGGQSWETEILLDEESNVFHKAMLVDVDGDEGDEEPLLMTIGANAARLKTWKKVDGQWQSTTHWAPTFGGKQERLRDVEVGDVTGDGRADVVIATHDMGVVAVAEIPADGGAWTVHEVTRTNERIFVHEVEIGDVDGDGLNEFFVTPSAPNVLDGTPQPGRIMGYRYVAGAFQPFEVASFLGAHVKEVLVADIEGRGAADLYAAIEPERKKTEAGVQVEDPLIIRRYRFQGDEIQSEDIAMFRDEQCRFLTAGDLTGDEKIELVASTMTTGIWMLRQSAQGWTSELVAEDSGNPEYEHAAIITDLDHNGRPELYVVADNRPDQQGALRRYIWNGDGFDEQLVYTIPSDHMTFNIMPAEMSH
jgi:hypothetical protein